MKLRLFTSRQTPLPRLVGTVVAAACLLAFGSSGARASVSDYPTLYLSGVTSSLLPGSYTLVTSAGPGTPSATPTVTDYIDGLWLDGLWDCLNYNWVYTEVDATGGETPPSPPVNFFSPTQWAEIGNLPTGVTVRLYRQCDNSAYTRVAELPNNSSSIYDDTMSDSTAAAQPVLPRAQNRIPLGTTGYQTFAPGGYADTSLDSALDPGPYATPNGKGWIVDGSGGVSFPTGTWTFKANVQQSGANGTAHLAVGMWKVTVSGNAITSSTMLLDPTGAGENSTNFVSGASITHAVTINGFSLAPNEHLYVQYWRHQTVAMASGGSASTVATMLVYDGTAQITHPAADGPPNLPTLNAPANASRANNPAPLLSANYADPESDNGTLSFQLCSDAACSSVLQSNTTSSIASGANGTWTPAALLSGTYYWRAQSTDSTSNASGWSATRSFVVDLSRARCADPQLAGGRSACRKPGVERDVRRLRSDRQRNARLPALLGRVVRERPPEHDVGDGHRRHRSWLDASRSCERYNVLLARPGNRRGRESDGVDADAGPELRLRHEPTGRSHTHEPGERRLGPLDADAQGDVLEQRRCR